MFRVRTPSRAPEPLRFVLGMIWLRLWGLLGPKAQSTSAEPALKQSGPLVVEPPPGPMTARKIGTSVWRCGYFSIARCIFPLRVAERSQLNQGLRGMIPHKSRIHWGCDAHFLKEGTQ
jgi:hypothetical protein